MLRKFCLLLLTLIVPHLWAQQVHLVFRDAPLLDALRQIDDCFRNIHIHFVINEIEDYRITATIDQTDAADALRQMVSDLGLSVRQEGNDIFINRLYRDEESDEARNPANAISSYCLQEVLVLEQMHNLYGTQPDIVLEIDSTDLAHRGNALNLISYLPGIWLDNGQLSTYDKYTPTIFIDDLRVNSMDELFSLRSEEISRIAYYESGNSAYQTQSGVVIRIFTHRPTPGWNANAQLLASQGHKASLGEEVKVHWSDDRWLLSTGIGHQDRHEYQEHHAPDFEEVLCPKIVSLHPWAQLSYQVTPHHHLGVKYDQSDILRPVSYWSKSTLTGSGLPFDPDNLQGLNAGSHSQWTLDYSPRHDVKAYYEGQWNKWQARLDLGYYRDRLKIKQNELTIDNAANLLYGHRINGISNRLLTERLQMTYHWNQAALTWGNEYCITHRQDSYTRSLVEVASMGTDRLEKLSVFYALGEWKASPLTLHAGLRYEYLMADIEQRQSRIRHTRGYLLPYVDLQISLGQTRMTVNYQSRTQRPTYGQLNGYSRFNQAMLFISGNPKLEPAKHHQWSLNLDHHDWHANVQYRRISNYLTSIVNNIDDVYHLNYKNEDSAEEMTATFTYSPRLSFGQLLVSSGVAAQHVTLTFGNGTKKELHQPIWHAEVHCPYSLSRNAQVWVDGRFHTQGHTGSMWQAAAGTLNLGLSLHHRQWDFLFQAEDLFHTGTSAIEYYGAAETYHHRTYNDTQRISVTLRYELH